MYHARFGGSNAARWSRCTGYLRLADTLPRQPGNRAAMEGTAQHAVMEKILREPDRVPADFLGVTVERVQITADHVAAMNIALDETTAMMDEFQDAEVWAERFYKFWPGDPPQAGGSADVTLIEPTRAAILDYKFGAVEVATGGDQNLFYLCAALRSHPDVFQDIQVFESIIVQPAFDPATIRTVYTRHEIERATLRFDLAIGSNLNAPPVYVEGDHCQWCPAAIACPKKTLPDPTLTAPADTATREALGVWMTRFHDLEQVAKQVGERLHHEMENGREVPGWKLVARRSEAQFQESATVRETLQRFIPYHDALDLLTPRQVSHIIAADVLAPLTRHPPAGSTIAPASDRRPAVLSVAALATALNRLRR